MRHAVKHIHFIGVGGSGMSPLAEILHRRGYRVSGSDLAASPVTERLAALGIRVCIGHAAPHIAGAQAVVTSTAVPADNPEVQAARARRVPVVPRAALLAELMRHQQGIAVAGTHGKTTTTSLVAAVLVEAGMDPTCVIGGQLLASPGGAGGSHARVGEGEFVVAEADESDASFLFLSPVISVVTNIDTDHMDTYGHSLERLHGAFVDFVHRLPFYGRAVLCSDDAGVRAVLGRIERPTTTYGVGEGVDLRAVDVQAEPGATMRFTVLEAGREPMPVLLNLAGAHNVLNALAAIGVARELEVPDAPIQRALATFAGVGRRFQRRGAWPTRDGGSALVIDDYGHHPAEMEAVLGAARGAFPGQRLVLAFQPHRYTRTRDCLAGFANVISRFDAALLTEVYPAGEAPIAGADGTALAAAAAAAALGRRPPGFVPALADMPDELRALLKDGDVLIIMGAGSIARLPSMLLDSAADAQEAA